MTAARQKLDVVQGYGNQLNGALRQARQMAEKNQFFLNSEGGTRAKYGAWAAAGVAVLASGGIAATAPLLAGVGFGLAAVAAYAGRGLERAAQEREEARQRAQEFVAQAQILMKTLQVAHADLKQEVQHEQKMGSSQGLSADYVQYQQERSEQKLGQQHAEVQKLSIQTETPSIRNSSGPSLS